MDFDVSWWKVAIWVLTTFGIVGTIALAALFPLVFKAAGAGVVRFVSLLLSYRLGCAVLAAIVAAGITDYVRHSIEDDRHAAEAAEFKAAQDARDERIKSETRALVLKEIADAKVADAATDKDVKGFTDALPKPADTGNPFAVGNDACRLRHIFGQAECGPDWPKGVSKADAKDAGVGDQRRHGLSSIVRRIRGSHQQGQQGN